MDISLTAKDAAGNTAESGKKSFRMPERLFTKPLARALIEQRKHLILAPEEAGAVVQMLDALLTYPAGLIVGSGTHIAIAMANSRLKVAEDRAGIDSVIGMLLQIAVNGEGGSMVSAKAQLDALRKELERSRRDGASPERIAELTQKLREALDRYMQSLMEESQKRMSQNPQNQQQQQPNGRSVTPQELQKMPDMIVKLLDMGVDGIISARPDLVQIDPITLSIANLPAGLAGKRSAKLDGPNQEVRIPESGSQTLLSYQRPDHCPNSHGTAFPCASKTRRIHGRSRSMVTNPSSSRICNVPEMVSSRSNTSTPWSRITLADRSVVVHRNSRFSAKSHRRSFGSTLG